MYRENITTDVFKHDLLRYSIIYQPKVIGRFKIKAYTGAA